MGNRRGKFVVAILGAFLILAWGTANGQPKEVKIGVILPLTGPAAKTGEQARFALEFAAEETNASGGIKSMGGAKIKYVFADHTGKAEVSVSEAERLATVEKVDAMMGCYMSGITLATTPVAERYKIPFVVIISTIDEITQRGFKYTFRATGRNSQKVDAHINSMIDIGKKRGYPLKTIGFVYENSEWGQSVVRGFKEQVKPEMGIKVVMEESYPLGTPDFTPIVLKAKAANPDAIIPVMYFQDSVLFTKTIDQMQWHPMGIVTGGGGFTEPGYIQQLGKKEARYISTVTFFHTDVLETMPWAKKVNERYKAKDKAGFMESSAMTYSAICLLIDALERAGSTDREKVRTALATTDIKEGPAMLTPMERLKIGPDGQNPYASVLVMQMLEDGDYHVVWPDRYVKPGVKWVWPDPRWKKK